MTMQYIKPDEEQIKVMQTFRDKYEALCEEIKAEIPPSRGQSLAITNLEQSAMWLNKAITKND